ncbi:EF hand [Ancylostoma ceylanicum]|uniref:EF hand n=1 Tax=Ancylostoma ceylanicum TaxID=53326 RepID=A0A0D6LZF0_9BILA|nr:EF hand [Ancylostoma ceylanicum]
MPRIFRKSAYQCVCALECVRLAIRSPISEFLYLKCINVFSPPIVLPPNDSEPVKRPIHLDGIQLERDGELNKEFRQEVLLGGDPKDSDELKEMVKKMFQETDTNNDGFLSVEELEERIVNNTRAHLDEGVVEAKTHFDIVDTNKDGRVSWEEYEPHYLSEDSQNDGHEHKALGENDNSIAGPERDSFNRADVNGDGSLDPEEWLSTDVNGDEIVKREEFAAPHPAERKNARDLMDSIDSDGDHKLSLKELLARDRLVEYSPLMSMAEILHDDL